MEVFVSNLALLQVIQKLALPQVIQKLALISYQKLALL